LVEIETGMRREEFVKISEEVREKVSAFLMCGIRQLVWGSLKELG
jgi:hypothetical protein